MQEAVLRQMYPDDYNKDGSKKESVIAQEKKEQEEKAKA
jgi:hypothetical protein